MLEEAGLAYHVLPSSTTDLSGRVEFVLSRWRSLFTEKEIIRSLLCTARQEACH